MQLIIYGKTFPDSLGDHFSFQRSTGKVVYSKSDQNCLCSSHSVQQAKLKRRIVYKRLWVQCNQLLKFTLRLLVHIEQNLFGAVCVDSASLVPGNEHQGVVYWAWAFFKS